MIPEVYQSTAILPTRVKRQW